MEREAECFPFFFVLATWERVEAGRVEMEATETPHSAKADPTLTRGEKGSIFINGEGGEFFWRPDGDKPSGKADFLLLNTKPVFWDGSSKNELRECVISGDFLLPKGLLWGELLI